ncbi:prolipoprotein diacylglyceryl transferase [Candidatus Nomurabacteria bacterium]|nr:prolipoprotein diacylglyceryl transferase [Candidatus Nomurabacteria bacterium]
MFWQDFLAQATLFSWGPVSIRWYGLLMVLAILLAAFYALKKAKNKPQISQNKLDELFFYLLIFGLLGARLYHVFFFSWTYFSHNLLEIFQVWHGGLAIQGALLAGVLTVYFWTKKNNMSFWQISDWLAPALSLGQFLGRWGNYFNQELFGKPSDAWYAIPIATVNRVEGFKNFTHFQPTFFYESILDLFLFFVLVYLIKKKPQRSVITWAYLAGYGLIRFSLEFLRIDPAPIVFGLRFPQLISLVLFLVAIFYLFLKKSRVLPKLNK